MIFDKSRELIDQKLLNSIKHKLNNDSLQVGELKNLEISNIGK